MQLFTAKYETLSKRILWCYQKIESKTITCVDCGSDVIIDSKDNQTTRCKECQHKHWNEYNAMKQREYYKKKKSV
jgi:hypothetical protein